MDSVKLLRTSQAAALLGVHPNTLRKWARKGVVKSYIITGRGDRRFPADSITEKMKIEEKKKGGDSIG